MVFCMRKQHVQQVDVGQYNQFNFEWLINPVIQNFLAVSLDTQGCSTFSFIHLIGTFSDDVVDHELGECNFLPSCYEARCSLRLLDSIFSVKKFPFPNVGNINRLMQPAWYLRTGPVRPNLALTALENGSPLSPSWGAPLLLFLAVE